MHHGKLWLCLAALGLTLSSCGYIGPVLPPSLHIPQAVTNLTVTQVGDTLQCDFTLPQQTTDQVPISRFKLVDLRIGPDVKPFDFPSWHVGSELIPTPDTGTDDQTAQPQPKAQTPAAKWTGKEVAVAIRTAQHENNYSQWSNVVHLRVVEPLQPPTIKADADAKGIKITIDTLQPESKVRIMRQGPNETQPVEAGVAETTEFIDTEAQYGTLYRYTAIAFDDEDHAHAVSRPSVPYEISAKDKFAPSVPRDVTALAGPASIEVSWERSPEPDTRGYYVFRSVDGGPFQRAGDMTVLPSYSDKDVQHGKKYRYQVSAVDQRNNESDRSNAIEVSF